MRIGTSERLVFCVSLDHGRIRGNGRIGVEWDPGETSGFLSQADEIQEVLTFYGSIWASPDYHETFNQRQGRVLWAFMGHEDTLWSPLILARMEWRHLSCFHEFYDGANDIPRENRSIKVSGSDSHPIKQEREDLWHQRPMQQSLGRIESCKSNVWLLYHIRSLSVIQSN